MANSISTAKAEISGQVRAAEPFVAEQETPLEQRTDVTVDELEKLSLPFPTELYDGKVVFKMPNFIHAVIQNNIGTEIGIYLKTNPIGLMGGVANYRLWPERKKESRAPDLSFICKDRLPQNLQPYLPMAPDLAVEILSPGNDFEELMEKVDAYLAQGAKLVWVVITKTREVLVCTAQGKHTVRDKLTAPELLPGFELQVKDIFAGL